MISRPLLNTKNNTNERIAENRKCHHIYFFYVSIFVSLLVIYDCIILCEKKELKKYFKNFSKKTKPKSLRLGLLRIIKNYFAIYLV